MKRLILLTVLAALSACKQADDAFGISKRSQGHYTGIGIYNAGVLWGKMVLRPEAKDLKKAQIQDDEHIIVVMDTHTGEVRQCGDHSAYCVTMAPWAAGRAILSLPANLSAHNEDKSSAMSAGDAAASAN